MSTHVFVKFLDKSDVTGFLQQTLDPEAETLDILTSDSQENRAIALQDICYIKFYGTPSLAESFNDDEFFEDVYTVTDELFHLRLRKKNNSTRGFYGYPTDLTSDYSCIFFTIKGLNRRRKDKPLGEFLWQMGLIGPDELNAALNDQKKLRSRRLGEIITDNTDLSQATVDETIHTARNDTRRSQLRVGDILMEAGLVTKAQVEEALALQEQGKRKRIGAILVERGLITEQQLLSALARKFGLRVVDLEQSPPDRSAIKSLPREIVERMQVLPIEAGPGHMVVATSTPTDPTISENLHFATNRRIELVVASASQIAAIISSHFETLEDSVEDLIENLDELDVIIDEGHELETVTETDSKVINLVNKVLIDAHKRGASDIHFEPGMGPQPLKIRYRKDGLCYTVHQIAPAYKAAIISRIKIISKLDIAEHRRPQSGKILLMHNKQRIEYRVEITPTVGGQEDAVLRVLSAAHIFPLEDLGFTHRNLSAFRNLLTKPYGIILCVGPTGSGKTTSLHSGLAEINAPDRKIWTAEDPVEITQSGLRQVQVNAKIGFTFEQALRSFLRADPDVIMIGEMRDTSTAKTAIGASLTGHLVLSTLHTNNAPETIARLIEMGADPYNFGNAMLGILAQRLVLRLCDHCKAAYNPSPAEYEELVDAYGRDLFTQHKMPEYSADLILMKATGCEECDGRGYSGRVAIHELMINSPGIRKAIKQNLSVDDVRELAMSEGMHTLRMDGVQKIFAGDTDLRQLNRVTT
mgnify:FL=1